jgi:hypothetical protein
MPRSSFSERDRHRFEQLLQGPLIPPPQSPKGAAIERLARVKNALRITAMKRHVITHYRGWAAGAIAVVGLAILIVGLKLDFGGQSGSIRLQALDQKGQLQIRWNPGSDAIRRAVAAKLYIIDGSERLFVNLDNARLRLGNVSYARTSDRVELRMELAQPDGKQVEEQATFVGVRPPAPDEFPLETNNAPAGVQTAPAPPPAAAGGVAQPTEIDGETEPSGHRARMKSVEQSSGTKLPFTCSAGDTFRKTDAPAGWDTFTCRGKNVWSLIPAQTQEDRAVKTPGSKATNLTAKPAKAATT